MEAEDSDNSNGVGHLYLRWSRPAIISPPPPSRPSAFIHFADKRVGSF
jgi:hypothetical protein